MAKYIPFFIFIILSISCTKEIEIKERDIEKRLVLNGLICPDSLISVRVSTTADILDVQTNIVDNAKVELFCNGAFIENGYGIFAAYNQTLSTNRARAIVTYLTGKGILRSRFEFEGLADSQPIASNAIEQCRDKNRRPEAETQDFPTCLHLETSKIRIN